MSMNIKKLVVGEPATMHGLGKDEHKTQPPSRYTETSLISKLEELGIGRPATFASIASIIQDRGYVKKVKNRLIPTFKGFALTRILTEMFPEYTDYGYTSEMETHLDEIAAGKKTREQFLKDFWNGSKGFQQTMDNLIKNIDWDKIRELSTISLGNGYSIVYNRNGAWLQKDDSQPNDEGFKPSVRLEDDDLIDSVLNPKCCEQLLESAKNKITDRELGELSSGHYKGWKVFLKDGKYGTYLQAVSNKKTEKPVNHTLPEKFDPLKISLDEVKHLFEEVKLPRNLSPNIFVGVGKKGAYIGYKKTVKSRKATFYSLPDEYDPRTVDLETVEKIMKEKNTK